MRRRSYFRNRHSLGALTAGLFGQATLVVSGPATARLLGVTGRGELAILAIVAMLSSQLGAAGLPTAVAYTVAMRRIPARTVLSAMASTWIGLCIVAGLVGAAVTVVVGHSDSPSVWLDALLVATWVISGMTANLALACFQGESRFRTLNWVRPISSTLSAAALLCLWLIAHRAAVSTVLAVIVVANLLACLIAARLALTAPPTSLQGSAPVRVRPLIRYGLASIAGASAPIDSLSIDQAIVSVMVARGQLGLYVVAGAFNTLPSVLVSSLGTIALPRIAGEPQPTARRRAMRRTATFAVLIAACTTLLAELVVAWLLPFAFGANFAPAVPAARILIVAGFLLSVRRILVIFLQALGRPGHTGVGEAAALCVLGIFALVLIPPLGIVGASIALLLAAGASDVYLCLALRGHPAQDQRI
jgi:O-antigen/teichoic acid export membrane protein